MAAPMITSFFVGFCVRIWLVNTFISDWISNRNEISTPLTSWTRVTEGVKLFQRTINPYTGDIFHETPIMLKLMSYMNRKFSNLEPVLFVIIDMFIALVLERTTKYIVLYLAFIQKKEKASYKEGTEKVHIDINKLQWSRIYVVTAYLMNPYSIAACLAKSTAIFNNLAIVLAIFYLLKGSRVMCTFFLACAAYQSLYPAMLVVPVALYLVQMRVPQYPWLSRHTVFSVFQTVLMFCVWSACLLLYSWWLSGNWFFLHSTYGFILSVPDLTPNVGLFWYFFTEMFEHFRVFFLCVFQINVFIYTVPLAIKLRDHPIFLLYIMLIIISVFKSYPSYADTTVYLALLPVWSYMFPYLRNSFVIGCMFVCSTVFGPIMYHLWIYAGSANANFYFAITLVYCAAQIFLLSDLLYAYLRRQYDLYHGFKPTINGKEATVILND